MSKLYSFPLHRGAKILSVWYPQFFFLLSLLFLFSYSSLSQSVGIFGSGSLGVNTSGTPGNPSSIFDISSTTKGLLVPRMAMAQRDAIATPETSLIIFQTDNTPGYYYNAGTPGAPAWIMLATTAANPWSRTAPDVYLTDGTDNVGIGTTAPFTKFQVAGDNTMTSSVWNAYEGVGLQGGFSLIRTRGTISAPTAVMAGDVLGRINFNGLDNTSNLIDDASVGAVATENFTGTAHGTDMIFHTTIPGTISKTEKVRITGEGNVGIGTTSPSSQFHLYGTFDPLQVMVENTGGAFKTGYGLKTASGEWFIGQVSASTFSIKDITNDIVRVEVDAAGNVGIGTTSPAELLDVAGRLRIGALAAPGVTTDKLYNIAGNLFWNGVQLDAGSSGWSITGNAGTVDGTNFIGTTDDIPFNIRVNNQKAGRIETSSGFGNNQSNTFYGYFAGNSKTTGSGNTASGLSSLFSNTIGGGNTAFGVQALYSNVAGSNATAVGFYAMLYANDQPGAFTNYNVAVGYEALRGSATPSANTGNFNTALGYQTLLNNTTGNYNTATGNNALFSNTTGYNNSAYGMKALYSNITASFNSAFGSDALRNNTYGENNVAIGSDALYTQSYTNANTNWATDNTAIGYKALYSNQPTSSINAYKNTATGSYSLSTNSTGSYNTASGYMSLYSNTSGNFNTSGGYQVMWNNTTGSYNTALGRFALNSNVAGSNATAVGTNAMQYANNQVGAFTNYNVAVGYEALRGSTTPANNLGNYNTALGYQTLLSNTSGSNNLALGTEAGYNNTSGGSNIYIGNYAGRSNSTVSGNVYIGHGAGFFSTSGPNTFIGYNSGTNNGSGSGNTFLGYNTGYNITTQQANTFVGHQAGYSATSFYNTFIGSTAGQNTNTGGFNTAVGTGAGLTNTTGNYNTYLGYGADASASGLTKAAAIGYNAKVDASNAMVLGGTGADAVNVGIGTTLPLARLDITGDGSTVLFPRKSSAGDPAGAANGMIYYNAMDNKFRAYQNGAWADVIAGAGSSPWNRTAPYTYLTTGTDNVGIGTSTPATKLHVSASVEGESRIRITNTIAGRDMDLFTSNAGNFHLRDGLAGTIFLSVLGASGNVGIGTTSPAEILDVNGRLRMAAMAAPGVTTDKLYNVAGNLFWNGVQLNSGSAGWSITGNAGTTPATNFLGTTDAADFVVKTSGTERMRVTSGGSLGLVGDFSGVGPIDMAEIRGAISSLSLNHTSAAQYSSLLLLEGGAVFGSLGHWGSSYPTNPNDLQLSNHLAGVGGINFNVNNDLATPVMKITNAGNVGIGTTAPSRKLSIKGDNAFEIFDGIGTRRFAVDVTATESKLLTSNGAELILGTSGTERARIDATGNVGIGTTAPNTKLDVNGNVLIGSDGAFVKDGPDGPLHVYASNITTFTPTLYLENNAGGNLGAGTAMMLSARESIYKAGIAFEDITTFGRGNLYFLNDGTADASNADKSDARMTITNSGNVGIGTTNPVSLLHVMGNVRLGFPAAVTGSITFNNSANANTITIQSGAASPGYTLFLPTVQGAASTFLQNDGAGNLSWAAVSGTLSGGSTNYIPVWTSATSLGNSSMDDNGARVSVGTMLSVGAGSPPAGQKLFVEESGASGRAGRFSINNAANADEAVYASTSGTGKAGVFQINNAANASPALGVTTNGTGNGGEFQISNSASAVYATNSGGGNAVYGLGSGSGNVIYGKTTGTGMAGVFELSNTALSADAVFVTTNGFNSKALDIRHTGTTGIGTNYGAYSLVNGARGAGSTNVGGYFSASGAANNYAAIFEQGNVGIGTISPSYKLHSVASTGTDYAVYGENNSGGGTSVGIFGKANIGAGNSGIGGSFEGGFRGIYALAAAGAAAGNAQGIVGEATGTAGNRFGVMGTATSTGPSINYGLYGNAMNASSGNYGLWVNNGETKITDGNGAVPTRTANGSIATSFVTNARIYYRTNSLNFFVNSSGTGDYSEYFKSSDTTLSVGEIVCLSTVDGNAVRRANSKEEMLIGIVSKYGTRNNDDQEGLRGLDKNFVNIGMLGQLLVKVSDENGNISPGDPLTLSEKFSGVAAKAVSDGKIIGYAMTHFPYKEGEEHYPTHTDAKGEKDCLDSPHVMALVQPSYWSAKNSVQKVLDSQKAEIEKLKAENNSFKTDLEKIKLHLGIDVKSEK